MDLCLGLKKLKPLVFDMVLKKEMINGNEMIDIKQE